MPSDALSIAELLTALPERPERIGLEAGPLSEWLVRGLADAGFTATLMETRQVRAALSAMTVKTDRNDARGMAHLLRMGWFRPVHVKSMDAREQRVLLSARTTLVRRLRDIENSVRGLLRGFGFRVPRVLRVRWAQSVRNALAGNPTLLAIIDPLLAAGAALLTLLYRLRVARLRALERLRIEIAANLHDDVGARLTNFAELARDWPLARRAVL